MADRAVTLAAWFYFTIGYIVCFAPFHLLARFFSKPKDRQAAFQKINHRFYRGFFRLLARITPGLRLEISDDVRRIRSAVIVCNHISYLDPILLISLFPRHKTIVKHTFFRMPVFGAVMRHSGYLPSETGGDLDLFLLERIQQMPGFLADGGNLFVFPEGTRSRSGRMGAFNRGAFKIARRCGAPVAMLRIENTHRLFRPGRFWFNTCIDNAIRVSVIGSIPPDDPAAGSVSGLMEKTRSIMEAVVDMETIDDMETVVDMEAVVDAKDISP